MTLDEIIARIEVDGASIYWLGELARVRTIDHDWADLVCKGWVIFNADTARCGMSWANYSWHKIDAPNGDACGALHQLYAIQNGLA